MRKLITLIAVAFASLATVVIHPAPATAAGTTICTGELKNVATPGAVEVPNGAFCWMSNVIVNGGVTVKPGGSLMMWVGKTLTINGHLTADHAFNMNLQRTTVYGNVAITGASSNSTFGMHCSKITGGLSITGVPGGMNFNATQCAGPERSKVGANVTVSGNAGQSVSFDWTDVTGTGTFTNNASVHLSVPAFGGAANCSGNGAVQGQIKSAAVKLGQCSGL